ncbi:gag-protease polyprotein [Cucumis melo var. makuwa]|uniref:Gag-protease polyprotein n=1 Tax=Cucumis melo var. makuwa TaxID=1194695 RepID=A0A5A7TVV2_CUCMM|nr:gag-protease polyprotein [Cucumis melo var. makuwa]TYK02610.1 gag-protease polyprotein [Cucumis melo var. makuwa]
MPPRKGARKGGGRGGRGDGRSQPEEQLAVLAANPNAPVTQVDLAAMEQRYQDMLQAALAPFLAAQQTQFAPVQAQTITPPAHVEAQPAPVQLSAKAKHLRDFGKYNPKTFDGSMDNPTKAQMWLTSIETIFWYMKYPEDQKAARTEKFVRGLRLDLQNIVRALRPATHADALRIALDLSLQERADSSKAAGRGSSLGQKRKAESQPTLAPQRDLRSGGVFQWHHQELAAAGRTLRELPTCGRGGRVHKGRFLLGSGVASGASNQGITPMLVLRNSMGLSRTSLPLHSREEFLPLPVRRPSELVLL